MLENLIQQQKIETTQNIIDEEEKWYLEIPELEPNIKPDFEQEKIKNMKTILIGSILAKFGIYLCFNILNDVYTDVTKQTLSNDNILTWVIYFSINILAQGSIGFSVDLFSLQAAWLFNCLISIFGICWSIIAQQMRNSEIIVFTLYIIRFSAACNYVIGSFILYDSSYALDKRFNYAGLFVVIGSYFPQLLNFLISFLQLEVEVQQISLLILSIIADFFGAIIVLIQYNKIDRIRNKSKSYQNYKLSRGIGITLKSIVRYYWNENIFYLLIILFVSQLITKDANFSIYQDILKKKDFNRFSQYNLQNYFQRSEMFSIILLVYPLLKKINSSKNLIINNYKYLNNLMIISFIIQIWLTIVTYFSESLPFYFLLCFYLICVVMNSCLCVTIAVICNQLSICLQIERCFIKCIGLGIFGVTQDLPKIIFIFQLQPQILFLIQTQIIIIAIVYHFYYLQHRNFNDLQSIALNKKTKQLQTTDTEKNDFQKLGNNQIEQLEKYQIKQ